jgi:hypothetical protein
MSNMRNRQQPRAVRPQLQIPKAQSQAALHVMKNVK